MITKQTAHMNTTEITTATYDKIADIYTDRYFDISPDQPLVDRFLDLLEPEAKILDVGCGPGNFTQYLVSQGFQVEGIDLSEGMLASARGHLPHVPLQNMDLRDLTYADKSFNGIFSAYSLIHVPAADIHKTLLGFQRVLTDKGYLFILAQKGSPDHMVDEPLLSGEKTFVNFFYLDQLVNDLTKAGFSIKQHVELPLPDPDSLSESVLFIIAQKQ